MLNGYIGVISNNACWISFHCFAETSIWSKIECIATFQREITDPSHSERWQSIWRSTNDILHFMAPKYTLQSTAIRASEGSLIFFAAKAIPTSAAHSERVQRRGAPSCCNRSALTMKYHSWTNWVDQNGGRSDCIRIFEQLDLATPTLQQIPCNQPTTP